MFCTIKNWTTKSDVFGNWASSIQIAIVLCITICVDILSKGLQSYVKIGTKIGLAVGLAEFGPQISTRVDYF